MKAIVQALLLGAVRVFTGARADWVGCAPSERQRIYFANHSSHLDTLAIVAALPPSIRAHTSPVAAQDYWGATAVRRFIATACLNAVLVDRSGGTADPLEPLAQVLDRGGSLVIFPEGTRGDGEIAPFRSGLYRLATRYPNAEIVPVYLENLHRILPKSSMLLVPLVCTLRFGVPLSVQPNETKGAFLQRARTALLACASGDEDVLTPAQRMTQP